jgi:hypothetical protein
MARAVCSSASLREAAPVLRISRLGRGLGCHVSAVSRGRFPGNWFTPPQLGPQLFIITGEAAASRFRLSSILMRLSAELNKNTKKADRRK